MMTEAETKEEQERVPRHLDWALAFAAIMFFWEMLSASRSTYQGPGAQVSTASIWALLIALGCYTAAILFLSWFFGNFPLVRKHHRNRLAAQSLATLVVLLLLIACRRDIQSVSAAALCVLMLSSLTTMHCFSRKGSSPGMIGPAVLAFVIMIEIHDVFFFHSSHRAIVTIVGISSFAALTIASILAIHMRKGGWISALFGALVFVYCLLGVRGIHSIGKGNLFPVKEYPSTSLVLVTVDTLRADYPSLHGGPVPTPGFEELAASGMSFSNAYSMSPWTWPSMIGLFSSEFPAELTPGATFEQLRDEVSLYSIPESINLLAEMLQDKGYTTACFVGNTLLSEGCGIQEGFGVRRMVGHRSHVSSGMFAFLPYFNDFVTRLIPELTEEGVIDSTGILLRYARRFISLNEDKAFFVWIHFMDPHAPHDPPDRFRDGKGIWDVFCPADASWGSPQADEMGNITMSNEERAYARKLYEGEIRYVDEAVSKLSETAQNKAGGEVIFCLTADHGEEFWDHGRYGHGHSLYNDLTRVPLILKGPRIRPALRIDQPVSLIDVMPTLAELLDVPVPSSWQGESLLRFKRDPETPASPVFAGATNFQTPNGPLQMVVKDNFKYIRQVEGPYRAWFDLKADPLEQHDLSESGVNRNEDMEALLEEWGKGIRHFGEEDAGVNEEALERLRDVGYLE